MSRDLDLLVRKQDIPGAEALMLSLGFSPTAIADDYHRPWLRGTTGVELHFDVENPLAFDFGIAEAWTNAKLSSFAGEPAWKFAEQDEILFLALHGVRHRFDRLNLVLDLALALELYSTHGLAVSRRNRRDGRLQSVLDLGTAMAHKLRPSTTSLSPKLHAHFAHCAERVWVRLLNEPPVTADWEAQHRFYLELESSLVGSMVTRRRHARILLSQSYHVRLRICWTIRMQTALAGLAVASHSTGHREDAEPF